MTRFIVRAMTRTPHNLSRFTATQPHGKHHRLEADAAVALAGVPCPPPSRGRPKSFQTPFAGLNDEIMERDRRSTPERILLALSRFLLCFLIACVCVLVWANWP